MTGRPDTSRTEGNEAVRPSDTPAAVTDAVRTAPASGLQRGLWFLDRLDPGAVTYTTPWTYQVTGPLDLDLLARALDAVTARHEALRTTFALHPDGPRQHVHPGSPSRSPSPTCAPCPRTNAKPAPRS